MIRDQIWVIFNYLRTRWTFLGALAVGFVCLTVAYALDSTALAAVGAVALFVSGEAKGEAQAAPHLICSDCGSDLYPAQEMPDPYPSVSR